MSDVNAKSRDLAERAFKLLECVEIFKEISPEVKRRLSQHIQERSLEPGAYLCRVGDPGDGMFLVSEGEVMVSLTDPERSLTVELAHLGVGECIGEMSLLGGAPRSADVSAVTETSLFFIERRLFMNLVNVVPQVGLAIASVLSRRLGELNASQGIVLGTLTGRDPDEDLIELVQPWRVRRLRMVPFVGERGAVIIATPEPHNQAGLKEISNLLRGHSLRLMAVSPEDFDAWIQLNVRSKAQSVQDDQEIRRQVSLKSGQVRYSKRTSGWDDRQGAPISNPKAASELITSILVEAIERDASDIHIDPGQGFVNVRFRVDGRMVARPGVVQTPMLAPLISRIKVLSGLDITERRLPQDGRMGFQIGDAAFDVRVSTVSTLHGEKVALRLLDSTRLQADLGRVILWEPALAAARRIVYQPGGFALVTGPSGAGKTTTLYAALLERNSPDLSIATAEDPIEYELEGVTQVQIKEDIGLTYPAILRSFLRQSPDIIFVGEVRDTATADLTGNAALTGHLVLSSFHTNDAISAIARLQDMNVEPYILASALVGIINQRLVRRLCPHCRVASHPGDVVYTSLGRAGVALGQGQPLSQPKGCDACNHTGYRGRVGIYEVLEMNAGLRDGISRGLTPSALRKIGKESGAYLTLADYAGWLLSQGMTTATEVLRVLPTGD